MPRSTRKPKAPTRTPVIPPRAVLPPQKRFAKQAPPRRPASTRGGGFRG